MVKAMGRILASAFVVLLLVVSSAFAEPPIPALTGRVVDQAGILDASTIEAITSQLAGYESSTGNQVVVVTLSELKGYPIEDWGLALGRGWGIGQKGKNNGVLLIVAPNDRELRIEVGYGLEGDLPDATANTIIDRAENPDVRWTEAQKNQTVGEARLIRAWAYWHLTSLFGDVPLNLVESSGTTIRSDWERTPVAEVQKQMEQDLLFAEQVLPNTTKDAAHVSKAVAEHYLAELYLTMNQPAKAEEKAGQVDRATLDLAEAIALEGYEGSRFHAVVTDIDERGAVTRASCAGTSEAFAHSRLPRRNSRKTRPAYTCIDGTSFMQRNANIDRLCRMPATRYSFSRRKRS